MNSKRLSKISFIALAAVFLWIKTYIVYKTSFEIELESKLEEFILLINPISSTILFFGLAMFAKDAIRTRVVLIISFVSTFILYANMVYYRFFNDFITVPVLFQTSNMGDLGSSIFELVQPTDFLILADLILLIIIAKKKKVEHGEFSIIQKIAVISIAIAMFVVNLIMAEAERPQLLTRTFDREMLVKYIGTYNYHIYDIVLQSKSKAQRAFADSSQLTEVENYTKANTKAPGDDLFGIAEGKNLIVISMESTQSFVINNTINGKEITPFLNSLIKDSYYFDNFYHQTGQGKTSDAEFITENSLYPIPRGAVFFTHSQNEYNAMPEILSEKGYFTAVLHANNKSFWNRDIMYKSLGVQRYYALDDYTITDENTVGWGLKDKEFFEQSIQHLKEMKQPFYAKFITLTNHFPFKLNEEDRMVDEYNSKSNTLNRYFPTVRYTDEAIKHFFERLKQEGLYDNSIIVIYGDHYGISENHNMAMAQYLGKEKITPFDSIQLQRVPLIIHIPGQKGQTISTVSGQIDFKPTMLHLLGIETRDQIEFGTDLFAKNRSEITVLRDGSFITKDHVYTDNKCYDKRTGNEIDLKNCEPFLLKAKQDLQYSDEIIYGDLLRFFDKETGRIKPEK